MKHTLILFVLAGTAIFSGCNGHGSNEQCTPTHKYTPGTAADTTTNFVPTDSCNKMISSYLNSIHYPQNDTDIYSLIYNADTLRQYLSMPGIVKVKFMLAHTLDYINNGGQNQYAGYQSGALTFVIAGYDDKGNYVFYYAPGSNQAMALDHCCPCPHNCPINGTAANNLFPAHPHNN